jgi:hypothetical protein
VAIAALALVVACAAPARADVVELRGSAGQIDGAIVKAGPAGIEVRSRRAGLEQSQTVPWSDVRRVDASHLPSEATAWLAAGADLWRGRIRVARGDWPLAVEPLLRAAHAWQGATPCAAGLAAESACVEALLRAGRPAEAVVPAFEAIRMARAGIAPAGDADPRIQESEVRVFDAKAPVPPMLAPGAFDRAAAEKVAASLAGYDARGDAGLAAVVAAYAAALGEAPTDDPPRAPSPKIDAPARAAVTALEALRDVRASDAKRRAAALVSLARARRSMPSWFEPWSRLATGIALASDTDGTLHERGLVLLASLQAGDRTLHPLLAARAAAEAKRLAVRPGQGTSVAALVSGPQGRPDSAVPRELSDATAAWLEQHGDGGLLVSHLEAQLEGEPEGDGRAALVGRLASIMAARLEREDNEARRDALMARAMSLVKRYDAGSEPLRLVILRAQYRAAQRAAEDRRAGRGTDAECEGARQQLETLVREFTLLAGRAARAKDASARDAGAQVGVAAEQTLAKSAREEETTRSAQFFRAWSAYYAAWLGRELGLPDWRGRADDAMRWFADLIEPGKAAIDPADVSVDLRGNEGFASAILGSGLAASLVQTGATADAWLALLEIPRTSGAVRLKLPAWRMASLLDRGELRAAIELLRKEGDGAQGVPMSLIAAARAGRRPDADGSAELLTEAVGRLVAAGKLRELSLISLSPGTQTTGAGARLFAAVRAVAEANRLKDAGKADEAAAEWKRAAAEIEGALGKDAPAAVAAGARSLNGYVLRGAGRPAEAADAFLAASKDMQGDRAGDARWMAVLSLDEAMHRPGGAPLAKRLGETVDGIVRDLPETGAAVRARAWRTVHADVPTVADIDALLGDQVHVELAPAARRAALDGLYRRFRALAGEDRRVAARRALAAGDDVAAGGGEEGTLELRRRLEMAVALDDRMRAADALTGLEARVAGGADAAALGPELAARRAQIAALDGRLDDARSEVAALDPSSPWGRVAAASLLAAVARNPACGPEVRASVAKAAVAGQGSPGPAEAAMWMRAEAELLRERRPSVDRAGAERAGAEALRGNPRSAALLLADADLRSASGDAAGAADRLRTLLASAPIGSEQWYEAKAMQVEAIAATDGPKARSLLEQVRQLGNGFGEGASAARLDALDARLPRAAAPEGALR